MKINVISDVHRYHFSEIISRYGVKSDPPKLQALTEIP